MTDFGRSPSLPPAFVMLSARLDRLATDVASSPTFSARRLRCLYGSCIPLSNVQWASTDATLAASCVSYCSSPCFFLPKPILNALLLRRARLLKPVVALILRPSPLPPE